MKNLLLILCLVGTLKAFAQEDTVQGWTTKGLAQLNFSQASFHNWAAGGENSIALTGIFNLHANYLNDQHRWQNNLKLAYGKIKSGEQVRKSEDLIDLTSQYGYQTTPKLAYTFLFNFKTQFDKGYNYPDDTTVLSKFLSPAFIQFSAGMNYKPTEDLSLFLSPLTAKFTYISDPDQVDPTNYGVDPGEQLRSELGAFFKAQYINEILTNVLLDTSLELFSNYLDNPQNIDINWQLLLGMKVNKYITASVSTQLIYDHDILVPKEDNGVQYMGRGTQFKEVIAIGLAYEF